MSWCNCYWYHQAHSPGPSRYEQFEKYQRQKLRLEKANKKLERSLHDAIQIGV
jgi:hypothetical protein